MKKETLLFEDKLALISKSFTDSGWITVYEIGSELNNGSSTIYGCLVKSEVIDSYMSKIDWEVSPGYEGKPCVMGTGEYRTYDNEMYQPFLYSKSFNLSEGYESYIDIAEEFVLYFNLYETRTDSQNRQYSFVDSLGELIEVIKVKPKSIKVRAKYLKEYISIRGMHFAICFDFMRFSKKELSDYKIDSFEKEVKKPLLYQRHLVKLAGFSSDDKIQSWLDGKLLIPPVEKMAKGYLFSYEERKYEEFIVALDEDGNNKYESCEKSETNFWTMTCFSKSVLDKYLNNPTKYKVDGWRVSCSFFSLKIDNNVTDYVPVFLRELRFLPYKEQLHWKQFNIEPQGGMSRSYHETMIQGNWASQPETPELFFKYRLESLNRNWEKEFGWKLFKPLAGKDEHLYSALHVPSSNNVKAFCEQLLSLSKILIDRLNEAQLAKNIKTEKGDRGLKKLKKFLLARGAIIPEIHEFFAHFWALRAGLLAHSFSNSNKDCKKAMEFFGIREDNYVQVANDVFSQAIISLNSLDYYVLGNKPKPPE